MAAELKGLGEKPLIMGVLNITPDSFSDGNKFVDPKKAIEHAIQMAKSGADIIDIGGESSRPGAKPVSADEELGRVLPVIKRIKDKIDIPISIDTTKSEVASKAVEAGAGIINDISALRLDERIADIAKDNGCYIILMHMRGNPQNMQDDTEYNDIIGDISEFLRQSAEKAMAKGISRDRIIIDPGIGFGKSLDGNFAVLRNLDRFLTLGYPVMVGASRKSFIGKTLDLDVNHRLSGSVAAACYAVLNGADIVRVHDVPATREALTIIAKIVQAERK